MLVNQVGIIIDDEVGSGLLLTERFLLEEAKVVLYTDNYQLVVERWGEEIETRRLVLVHFTEMNVINLIQYTVQLYSRMDFFIQCEALESPYLSDYREIGLQDLNCVEGMCRNFMKFDTSTLLFINMCELQIPSNNHIIRVQEEERIDKFQLVSHYFLRNKVRHNLLLNDTFNNENSFDLFSNTAVFLSSGIGKGIFAQAFDERDINTFINYEIPDGFLPLVAENFSDDENYYMCHD